MPYSKEKIKKIIPYDDPFLWVEEAEEIKGDSIIGYKQTLPSDEYFKGHFVDFPIMPGVLIVEGIAQTATIILREKIGRGHEKNHLLAYQVRHASFLSPVLPGDKIEYRVKLLGFYNGKIANFFGEAYVGEEKKCEARFTIAIMDKKEMREKFIEKKSQKITELPTLKINNLEAKYPIIQGGMAVRVSLHRLAGNVAKNGGIGVIAVSGMSDPEEVKFEIRKAREIAGPKGIIGINIMGVIGNFVSLVRAAIEEKIDLIIQGAGFREDIFEIGKKYNIPIISMASSLKVAQRGEEMGATAIVIEGSEAGGHLGFPKGKPFRKTIDILKEVVGEVKIPLIAAGGIFSGKDIVEMLKAGAKGVQIATRFVSTKECDADDKFKQAHIKAKEKDVVIVRSPVGLPGRVVKTPFVEKLLAGIASKPNLSECEGCIGPVCDKSYCILKALENARKGDLENGLVFAGSNVARVSKITTVKELIQELVDEANAILKKDSIIAQQV